MKPKEGVKTGENAKRELRGGLERDEICRYGGYKRKAEKGEKQRE